MRLGEILVGAGLLTSERLTQALTRQKSNPGRLGTQIVHLGFVTADQIALALARQHHVPPVLVRHFVHHDPGTLKLISAQIAAEHMVLPIAFATAGGRRLVVCLRDPRNTRLIHALQDQLKVPIVASVASELAIQIYLGHFYEVEASPMCGQAPQSGDDDIDVDMDDFDEDEHGLDNLQLVDLDHHEVEKTFTGSHTPALGRTSALQDAIAQADAQEAREEAAEAYTDLASLLDAIAGADKRSQVSDAIMSFMKQRFAAGLIFTVKDGLAMGDRGFGGHLDDQDTVAALMLPLANGVLGAAHDSRVLWRGDPSRLPTVAQSRFLKLFDLKRDPQEVVVVPVFIGTRVLCLLYAHGEGGVALTDPEVDELAEIAGATNKAFERIIRSRRT